MATRKRRSGLIFFLLALVLIVILVIVAFAMRDQLLALVMPQGGDQAAEESAPPPPAVVDVVITVQSVKRGDVISEAMLGTASYPQEYLVEGLFFTDIADVVGTYAKTDLEQGRFLTSADLYEGGDGSFASFEIPKGMVALTIPIPNQRYLAAYGIKAGDYVNILASVQMLDLDQEFQSALPNSIAALFKREVWYAEDGTPNNFDADLTLRLDGSDYLGRVYQDPSIPNEFFYVVPSEGQRPRWVTQSIVQNVQVLWVGDLPYWEEEAASAPAEGEQTADEQAAAAQPTVPPPASITVALTQQDAVALNYLILAEADINFVLRSAGDTQIVETQPVTLQFIMDQYNVPYPAKLPYGVDMSGSTAEGSPE